MIGGEAGVFEELLIAPINEGVVDVRGDGVEMGRVPEQGVIRGAAVFGEVVALQEDFDTGGRG